MKMILLSLALGGSLAFATPPALQDGIYETAASTDCVVQIVNDSSTGGLVMVYLSGLQGNCSSSGQAVNFARAGVNRFINDQFVTVDMAWIANCSPAVSNPMPCEAWYYDTSGRLMAQIGDQIDFVDAIVILNNLNFHEVQSETWSRDGVVMNSNTDSSVLYTKK